MPPIRRALSFTIFILIFFIFLHLPSRTALRSLFSSQENALYSSSYNGISHKPKYRVEPSISSSTQIETSIPGSEVVTGFTLLDRVYLRGGTFFIVTANKSAFPPKRNMIAPGLDMGAGHDMEPTDKELRIIGLGEAEKALGQNAIRIDGFSVVVYDTEQFMRHFYHWWGEIVLGSWRVYSAIFPIMSSPPFPARYILPFIHSNEWRDTVGVNAPLMRACFPSTTIETIDYWEDFAKLDRTFVFDRVIIVSRETSGRHPSSGKWFKMISSTMGVDPAPGFFEPIRRTAITNLLGYLPILNARGVVIGITTSSSGNEILSHDVQSDLPVVTYISRQGGARRLSDADHEGLVQVLKELERDGVCTVNVVRMETMGVKEQVAVLARTTVLIGVHGNGMTHQIWMTPSSRSTVIEIFTPNGYLFDYEILARNLGHKHYAVWNDTLKTFPKGTYHEGVNYAEDFHGASIPVHGPSVAQVIRERLAGGSLWGG